MAISTYKVFLMYRDHGSSDEYQKLVDIKSFPDLGGTPEKIETTSLSDGMQTFILGVQTLDVLEFNCNYTKEDYVKVKAMEGTEYDFAVWFGASGEMGKLTPTGADGKFAFSGQLSVYPAGGGVNEVVDMPISISASTPIVNATDE